MKKNQKDSQQMGMEDKTHSIFQHFWTAVQEPESDRSEHEHEDIPYTKFSLDAESDSAGDLQYCLQDERLHLVEERLALEEHQELERLGMYLFMIAWAPCWSICCIGSHVFLQCEKDNLRAAAYKVIHQVSREAFEGLWCLTGSHMDIGSDFVTNQILEKHQSWALKSTTVVSIVTCATPENLKNSLNVWSVANWGLTSTGRCKTSSDTYP